MSITRFSYLTLIIFSLITSSLFAQTADSDHIEKAVSQTEIEFHINFLAADEFLGRDTGTHELDIASRYIATWLQTNGIKMAAGYNSYFQEVPFHRLKGPESGSFIVGDTTYTLNRNFIAMNSERGSITAPIILMEYGTEEEFGEHDVAGKIVIASTGFAGQTSPQQFFNSAAQKREWAKEAGAVAFVELFSSPQIPWSFLANFLGGDRVAPDEGDHDISDSIIHLWLNTTQADIRGYLESMDSETATLEVKGEAPEKFTSRNVIGVIEGTDSKLKNEYILLSAHYDHIGVLDNHPEPITSEYIFNGARDNAVGTAGVLAAGKYLAENPPKRSVILAAWTAEEIGLLGSRYFSDNPMIPLEQIVFNLNIDGAGYNDTTKVTVIGLGRTEADPEMKKAASSFGLEAIPDPVPEQNLFDRSDNVNFARNGIPAPTYSMGLTAFDDEINKYYHQTADHPNTVDYNYVTRYIRSFVLAAQIIANRDEAPFWLPGDIYEEAGIELYNRQ
jgi:hypothetical protein